MTYDPYEDDEPSRFGCLTPCVWWLTALVVCGVVAGFLWWAE